MGQVIRPACFERTYPLVSLASPRIRAFSASSYQYVVQAAVKGWDVVFWSEAYEGLTFPHPVPILLGSVVRLNPLYRASPDDSPLPALTLNLTWVPYFTGKPVVRAELFLDHRREIYQWAPLL